jgi:hypothetical protein
MVLIFLKKSVSNLKFELKGLKKEIVLKVLE